MLSEVLNDHLTLLPGEDVRKEEMRPYVEAGLEGVTVVARKERTPVCVCVVCVCVCGGANEHHALLRPWYGLLPERLCMCLQANAVEYYAIDISKPLSSQLAGKVVVEFPTFLVLLPSEVHSYALAQPAATQASKTEERLPRTAHSSGTAAGPLAAQGKSAGD